MARRVVSWISSAPEALCGTEPVIDANAYALAEDVDLTLVLAGGAVELAVAGGGQPPRELAGIGLPPAASGQELRGLMESGVAVHVVAEDAAARGLDANDFTVGIAWTPEADLAELLGTSDAVLRW